MSDIDNNFVNLFIIDNIKNNGSVLLHTPIVVFYMCAVLLSFATHYNLYEVLVVEEQAAEEVVQLSC